MPLCERSGTSLTPASLVLCVLVTAAVLSAGGAHAFAVPPGKSQITIEIAGEPIEVYTYKPAHYAGGALLVVLHGVGRNAAGYRDYAMSIADRHGYVVAAPLFDRKRFPSWRYQWGGIVRNAQPRGSATFEVQPEREWTGHLLLKVMEHFRSLEGNPALPYRVLGHSGGAQALTRVSALMALGAERIVIANAGSYLWPASEVPFPDGLGGLPAPLGSDETLRRYLAQPITLLLGTADVHQDSDLPTRDTAAAQGLYRYERGSNFYRAAQGLAQKRGWPFNWKLVEVPGVGHSAGRMLRTEQAAAALAP